jgi:P pilus assembly chaperone PapD
MPAWASARAGIVSTMYNPSTILRPLLVALALLPALTGIAGAQIEVAPTRVLVNLRQRSQEVTVYNPTTDPVEVTTDLGFKLIRSDSLGRVTLESGVADSESARSCKDWVRIFPRRFMVPPGTSRSVRILLVPPDSLSDGEYWGRAIFGCTPMKTVLDEPSDTATAIRTSLTMRVEFDIPIVFRMGAPSTGIDFLNFSATSTAKGALGLIDLKRLGNSAYRGTLAWSLRDADGREIAKADDQYTVEFTLRKGLALPRLAPGAYTIEVESKSVKKGAANDVVIAAPTVRKVYAMNVSAAGIQTAVKE